MVLQEGTPVHQEGTPVQVQEGTVALKVAQALLCLKVSQVEALHL